MILIVIIALCFINGGEYMGIAATLAGIYKAFTFRNGMINFLDYVNEFGGKGFSVWWEYDLSISAAILGFPLFLLIISIIAARNGKTWGKFALILNILLFLASFALFGYLVYSRLAW